MKLREISVRAEAESKKPGWDLQKWNALCEEAAEATHGHEQFTEFMARYMP